MKNNDRTRNRLLAEPHLQPHVWGGRQLANAVRRDERGLSTVEYVILLALIAVVGIGVWKSFGETLMGKVNQANTTFRSLGE